MIWAGFEIAWCMVGSQSFELFCVREPLWQIESGTFGIQILGPAYLVLIANNKFENKNYKIVIKLFMILLK